MRLSQGGMALLCRLALPSLVVLMTGLMSSACTGTRQRPRTPTEPDALPWELRATDYNTRRLYRLHYSGPDGAGSIRLALHLESSDRFRLAASDLIGRSLWTLSIGDGESRLVNHRRKQICEINTHMVLRDSILQNIPLSALPALLIGYLPVNPTSIDRRSATEIEFRDRSSQRWTAEIEGFTLMTWTLWSENEPTVWWTRTDKGGILSHRQGSQFRWRQGLAEPLSEPLEILEFPDSYDVISCDQHDLPELRQDQSSSPGSGSP